MITLISKTGEQKLSILDYNEENTRTNNVRYRAVINDDQTAVLHLQSVDIKDSHQDVSQLSLCPGVLESEVLQLLSQAPVSNGLACSLFIIENVEDRIMYRWVRPGVGGTSRTDVKISLFQEQELPTSLQSGGGGVMFALQKPSIQSDSQL